MVDAFSDISELMMMVIIKDMMVLRFKYGGPIDLKKVYCEPKQDG